MTGIVVIGAGGFGRETLDVIEAINLAAGELVYQVRGVVDDSPSDNNVARLASRGYQYLGGIDDFMTSGDSDCCVVAVGNPLTRATLVSRLAGRLDATQPLIHPSAIFGSQFECGEGTVICAGVQISTNVSLGAHDHLNPGAIVGHDSQLADYVSVNPGAIISGEVTVSSGVLVGAGAVILQGLSVAANSTIGASACVVGNVGAGSIVKGVPAK